MTIDNDQVDPAVKATLDLVQAVPPLRGLLDEHIADFGEVIPVVVWAPFRDALVSRVESGDDVTVASFLDVVERLAASDDDAVRNLVEVAFLEDGLLLSGGREHATLNGLRPRFGPATSALLDAISEHNDALTKATRREG